MLGTACLSSGCSSVGYYGQAVGGHLEIVGHAHRTGLQTEPVHQPPDPGETGGGVPIGVGGADGWGRLIDTLSKQIRAVDTAAFAGRSSEQVWLHSDHQPFLLAGVPVIYPLSDLGKHVYGCYHSSCDDIHLVEPRAMTNNVRFVGALLYELAAAARLPGHFDREELRTRLIAEELEGPLRIGGDWPWE